MKYASLLLAAMLIAAAINPVTADEQSLPPIASHILRQPALSPDGSMLAFVYDGDIWSAPSNGGLARRLTVTPGNEGDPLYAPDGNWLAFRSRRTGSDCIYVMPAEGGEARRLTWSDAYDYPCCWLPDSSGIIFSSYRRQNARDLWVARLDGSEPWPISNGGFAVHEFNAAISPDGKRISYLNRGSSPQRRRGYHGTGNSEVWVCDFDGTQTSNHRRLSNNRSHNFAPTFINNDELIFVTYEAGAEASDRVGRIVGVSFEGRPLREWGRGVRVDAREISVGGGKIAFSTGNYAGWQLHVGDLSRTAISAITTPDIRVATDRRDAGVRTFTRTTANEYAVSPDGKKIAFVAGGDVFLMPADEHAVPAQITDTLHEETSLVWAPDSRHLAFTEKVTGTLLTVDAGNIAGGATVHDMGGARVSNLNLDPYGRLWGVVDEAKLAIVHQGGVWSHKETPEAEVHEIPGMFHGSGLFRGGYDFSPDGRWLTYVQPNELYNGSVVMADTYTGIVQPISFMFGTATGAAFSRDGKRVLFSNNQEGSYDVWAIDLEREPLEFPEDKLDRLFDEPKEGESSRSEGDKAPPATSPHFEGMRDRVTRLTTISGNVFSPIALSDGKSFFFVGQNNVWRLTRDPIKGPDLKQLTRSRSSKSQLSVSKDEKTLWWLESGKITSMPVARTNTTTYNFSVEQRRDATALRRAAFDEAKWVMGNYFYDREHHGIDWNATAERYRPALESVGTGDEYGELMNELLGELNSSHQGYSAFDDRSDNLRETLGYLGVLLDPVELSQGRYRVTEVVQGGPLDLPEDAPVAPFYLVGINGSALTQAETLSQHMLGATGKRAILHVNSEPAFEGAATVAVKPITRGAEQQLWYKRWVEGQREMVERLSERRLGYVHIRAMNSAAVRDFKHHLGNAMLGRDGVVIDVRYNGGGSTAVDVLEILIKRPWLTRQYGDRPDISENIYRSVALEKPTILMINDSSFSNAEIMAEGFRRLELGQIVGVDTPGGVIGTTRYSLIDGSTMRLPRIGAYTVDGENLENIGRKADIFVENHPDELDQGIDRQTEAAVKALLEQLDK